MNYVTTLGPFKYQPRAPLSQESRENNVYGGLEYTISPKENDKDYFVIGDKLRKLCQEKGEMHFDPRGMTFYRLKPSGESKYLVYGDKLVPGEKVRGELPRGFLQPPPPDPLTPPEKTALEYAGIVTGWIGEAVEAAKPYVQSGAEYVRQTVSSFFQQSQQPAKK
ncbi:hypothetical protein HZB01_03910 [Candidatus Woesearchaeota archaeon]|nr:hypothetical protein [Candidatus Woesearchaeota archaeon]